MATEKNLQKSWQINPELTPFIQDYIQRSLIWNDVLPGVPAGPEEWIRIPKHDKDRVIVWQAKRGIGAPRNRIPLGKNQWTDIIQEEYDAYYGIDYRLSDKFQPRLRAVMAAADVVNLFIEKEVADLVQDTASYSSDHFNDNITIKWDQVNNSGLQIGAATSVGKLVSDAAYVIHGKEGVLPNVMTMGFKVWDTALKYNPELLAIVRQTTPRLPIASDLMQLFPYIKKINIGIGSHFVPTGVSADGLYEGAFSFLWGNNLLLSYDPLLDGANPLMQAPAFGYNFLMDGFPAADDWDEPGGKIHNYGATRRQKPVILTSTMGYLFKDVLTV